MLQNIATEEFGHLEMVALIIEQHIKRSKQEGFRQDAIRDAAVMDHIWWASRGTTWDACYVNKGGNLVRDLRADIAAEAGALAAHESLIRQAPDEGSREALRRLATREVARACMFMKALESMNKLDDPMFGDLKPDDTVDVYFNLTTGPEAERRRLWNSKPEFHIGDVAAQAQRRGRAGVGQQVRHSPPKR